MNPQNIINNFPKEIQTLIDDIEFLPDSVVNFEHNWVGSTDYIDSIPVLQQSIMIGIDQYNREFITFKISKKHSLESNSTSTTNITLFKRYTDNPNKFVFGGAQSSLLFPDAVLQSENLEILSTLIKGEEYHNEYGYFYIENN